MPQTDHLDAIEKRLWSAADNLRANSNYASNEYFLPVMGLIFLRHAYNRYLAVKDDIRDRLPKRGGKTRALTKEDFSQKSADAIAAGLSPFQPHTMAIKAGRLMMSQIQEYVIKGVSFAFETTLSGRGYARMIPDWQSKGYEIKLFFLRLSSAELAISRVNQRVREGRHWIDSETISRRYHAGLANFENIYKSIVNQWVLYDNSKENLILIDKGHRS